MRNLSRRESLAALTTLTLSLFSFPERTGAPREGGVIPDNPADPESPPLPVKLAPLEYEVVGKGTMNQHLDLKFKVIKIPAYDLELSLSPKPDPMNMESILEEVEGIRFSLKFHVPISVALLQSNSWAGFEHNISDPTYKDFLRKIGKPVTAEAAQASLENLTSELGTLSRGTSLTISCDLRDGSINLQQKDEEGTETNNYTITDKLAAHLTVLAWLNPTPEDPGLEELRTALLEP